MKSQNIDDLRELVLHFERRDGGEGPVSLESVEQCISHILAANRALSSYHRKRLDDKIAGKDADFAALYELGCSAARPGSFDIAVNLGTQHSNSLSPEQLSVALSYANFFHDSVELVDKDDYDQLSKRIEDPQSLEDFCTAFEGLNANQNGTVLHIRDVKDRTIYNGENTHAFHLSEPATDTGSPALSIGVAYYTGRLNTIGVKSTTLTLDLVNGGVVELPYTNFDDLGIQVEREQLVQVCGPATRSSPHKRWTIDPAEPIQVVDETPIELDHVWFGKEQFTIDPPAKYSLQFNEAEEFYEVQGDFEVYFTEATRKDVESCLRKVLESDWRDIAMEPDDETLAEGAQELRKHMQDRIKRTHRGQEANTC